MKRVRINTGQVGLVFKNGDLKDVLTAGVYWLGLFNHLELYSTTQRFTPVQDLNTLLSNDKLREILHLVEVADDKKVLCFENGNFKTVLLPGRYAYFKGIVAYAFVEVDFGKVEITESISRAVMKNPAVAPYLRVVQVAAHEKALLYVDGKYTETLASGEYFYWNNSIALSALKVDMRNQMIDLSGQEVLTKDKAALRINFTAQYKVVDAERALQENKEYEKQLYALVQLALREYIGKLSLDELLENKESVGEVVLKSAKSKVAELGVKLSECGIKDVILPGEVKDIMSQVLVAEKKAQANVISRREETASTRSMLNSAKLMDEYPMLYKLKEMEYTEKIAERINSISLSGGNQVLDQLRDIFSK